MASSSQSLVLSSSSETPAPQAAMPASAVSSSPVETASSRSTDPAIEVVLLTHDAVHAEQATAAVRVASTPGGAVADEPWNLDVVASTTVDERRITVGAVSATADEASPRSPRPSR
eukprot:5673514-Lingulodinium_polyedra.AAC.1